MELLEDLKTQLGLHYDQLIAILPRVALGIVASGILFFILRIIRTRLIKFLSIRADDKLLMSFANSVLLIVNATVIILLFLYIVGLAGIATSILGAAGVSAFVIGFALKDIGENFLAGVIMAFDRPFRLGDTVMTGTVEGTITEMSLRDTHIKTFDGKDVYVPNGQIIKNPLYNYTIDGFLRKSFSIGIGYGSDIEKARSVILKTLQKVPGVIQETKVPKTMLADLGVNTINITVQYWVNTLNSQYSGTEIHSQALREVLTNLEQAGFNMPGNILELKNYNGETLSTK